MRICTSRYNSIRLSLSWRSLGPAACIIKKHWDASVSEPVNQEVGYACESEQRSEGGSRVAEPEPSHSPGRKNVVASSQFPRASAPVNPNLSRETTEQWLLVISEILRTSYQINKTQERIFNVIHHTRRERKGTGREAQLHESTSFLDDHPPVPLARRLHSIIVSVKAVTS